MKEKVFDRTKIRDLRTSLKLSVEEFAHKIGTKKQMVSAWETEVQMPRIDTLVRICNTFDVPVSFFIVDVHHSKQRAVKSQG